MLRRKVTLPALGRISVSRLLISTSCVIASSGISPKYGSSRAHILRVRTVRGSNVRYAL
jgi:hypothetical protein